MASIREVFGPVPPGIDLSQSRVNKNIPVFVVMLVLAATAVVLRFYARLFLKKVGLGIDDYTIAAASVFGCALFSASVIAGQSGVGKHVWALSMDDVVAIEKNFLACILMYTICLTLVKISIITLYRRIFGNKWQILACLYLALGWGIGVFVAALVACQPVSYFWDQYPHPHAGKCLYDLYTYYIANAAVNVTIDGLILAAPMPIIWRLQMRKTERVLVCGIFLLGGLVCVASIVRIVFLAGFRSSFDVSWLLSDVYVWSEIELAVAVICSCLPTLHPLLRRIIGELTGSRGSRPYTDGSFKPLSHRGAQAAPKNRMHFRPDHDDSVLTSHSAPVPMDSFNKDSASEVESEDGPTGITVRRNFEVREDPLHQDRV